MTVALLGIGADSTNSSPLPPINSDGSFEYISIPESRGPKGTTENRTYGNTKFRFQSTTMAEYLDYIQPQPKKNKKITGERLANWPLHYDPNFEALTYGETITRRSYTKILLNLKEGDIVAFYTGLRGKEADYTHRYIIGYFTVNEIIDMQNLPTKQKMSFSDLSLEEQKAFMKKHRENAHAKRFLANERIFDEDGLVICDGKKPGRLLDKAFRISKHREAGHHYFTDELQVKFSPEPGGNPERKGYLGGIKKGHVLNILPKKFRRIID